MLTLAARYDETSSVIIYIREMERAAILERRYQISVSVLCFHGSRADFLGSRRSNVGVML